MIARSFLLAAAFGLMAFPIRVASADEPLITTPAQTIKAPPAVHLDEPVIATPTTPGHEEPVIVAPHPAQTVDMMIGHSESIKVKRPFKTIKIVEPSIADAVALTDQEFTLLPKAIGETTVSIFDEKNAVISRFDVVVSGPVLKEQETGLPTFEHLPGRIKIHNQQDLHGSTFYQCTPNGCELLAEQPLRVEAPEIIRKSVTTPTANGGSQTVTTTRGRVDSGP